MAETKCEQCLFFGTCIMPNGCGCDEFESETEYVESRRYEYRDAFESYLDAFEND